MKTLYQSALAAACLTLVAAPVAAQVPGIDLRINPRIGLYTPLTNLAEENFEGVQTAFELDNSLALGLGIELDLAGPIGVRANLDYATSSSVQIEDGAIEDTNETTLLAVVGDVMFRPLPRLVVAQPYLFVGGGLKQYDFQWDDMPSGEDFIESESDGTLHVGGGLDVGLGGFDLNAEIGDYISWFEPEGAEDSEMQHDLFVTIGFSIGLL